MSTSDQATISLISALSDARIPAENHEFIRAIAEAMGIVSYRVVHQERKTYVVVNLDLSCGLHLRSWLGAEV